ncbi:MAG: tripartite tricarboxylate transporter substrate binding protein, partial [Thermodesulfobacteriota bacterium]
MKKAMFFLAVFVVMGLAAGVGNVSAAAYPERAIEIIVPFGVGGGSDTAARAVGEGLKPLLKVPL